MLDLDQEDDMALRAGGRRKVRARAKAAGPEAIDVSEEQRRRLAECCAFFMAARFRPSRPGGFRKRDLTEAEACIDAIVEKHKPH